MKTISSSEKEIAFAPNTNSAGTAHDSDEKYSVFIENAPNPIAVVSPDHVVLYVNPAFSDLTGFSSSDIVGSRPPFPWWPADLREDYANHCFNNALTELTATDRKCRKKNGEVFWVALASKSVVQDGEVKFKIVNWNDITDRKKAELEVSESEEHFRLLTKLSPSPLCVNDGRGKIEYVNDKFTSRFGYVLEDVPTVEAWYRLAYPDEEYREQVKSRWEESKQRARQANVPVKAPEAWITCKDGSCCVAEVSAVDIGAKRLVVFNDITERKLAGKELQENEAKYRNLFETMAQGVVYHDGQGKVISLNPAAERILGYSLSEIAGTALGESKLKYLQEDGTELPDEAYPANVALVTGNAVRDALVGVFNPREDKYRWLNVSAIPEFLPEDQQKPSRVFTTLTDLTEHKQALDLLRAAQIEVQSSLRQTRTALEGSIGLAARIVEMKDPYTAGHQERVAKLSAAIARELQMPIDQVAYLDLAAKVHDIGKIQVPAEILNKAGKLTELEFQMMRTHAQAGYDILKTVDFPWPLAKIVLQHHERLDGSGYPHGLKGDEILLGARIIAVADILEAMSGHRPYRPSLGMKDALAQIKADRGTVLDSRVVDACVDLIENQGFSFEDCPPLT